MRGLILKDLILLKANFRKMYLIIIICSSLPALQNPDYFLVITTFLVSMLLASQIVMGISFDEQNGWKRAALSMPIIVKQIIISKYVLAVGLGILAMVILTLTGSLAGLIFKLNLYSIIFSVVEGFLLVILFNLLTIPVAYKYGTEATKYFLLLFIAVPITFTYICYYFSLDYDKLIVTVFENKLIFALIGIFTLVLCSYISIQISIKSYKKLL